MRLSTIILSIALLASGCVSPTPFTAIEPAEWGRGLTMKNCQPFSGLYEYEVQATTPEEVHSPERQFWGLPYFFYRSARVGEPKLTVVELTVPDDLNQFQIRVLGSDGAPISMELYRPELLTLSCNDGVLTVTTDPRWTGGGEAYRSYIWTDELQIKKRPDGGLVSRHEWIWQDSFLFVRTGKKSREVTYYLVAPAKRAFQ